MMSADWQRARSDFNHGWLRNRLLVTLLKCMRIVSGQVEDGDAGGALGRLIAEWNVMHGKARSLLDHMNLRITAPMEPTAADVAICGDNLASFLLEVERQRWLSHTSARERVEDALREIAELDRTLGALAPCLEEPLGTLTDLLDDSMHAARKVAERFSQLTIPRDFIIG